MVYKKSDEATLSRARYLLFQIRAFLNLYPDMIIHDVWPARMQNQARP